MTVWVSREQIVHRIRDAGWKLDDQSKRVEMYRKKGSTSRFDLPKKDYFTDTAVRVILKQAGLIRDQIEQFLRDADTRTDDPRRGG